MAAILIFIGIIRGYFGSVFGPFGAFIDGCIIGMFATFYILSITNVIENMPKGFFKKHKIKDEIILSFFVHRD